MTLRQQTYSGVRWTTFSTVGQATLQIGQLSVLARLLTPADFGLFAVVTSIMAFLQVFADSGVSNAVIHHQDISGEQLSSLYWLNVGVSSLLAVLLAVSSPWIATWYAEPKIKMLFLITACTLVVGAAGQQIRVLAQKDLRFDELAKVELAAATLGFVVAVVTARRGGGVYSIVAGSLANATLTSILAWRRLARGWRPQFRLNFQEIRHFLSFGAYMIGNNLANTLNSQVDIMLGGKLLSPAAIGLYSLPRDLNLRLAGIINPIVTKVGLPVMAKAQSDRALLKRVYLQTMRMTASINFPIYTALAIFAPEIVHLLLGPQWGKAIPLLRILAVWGLVRSTGNPIGSLLMACGRADLSFKWNLAWLVLSPPVIWYGSLHQVAGMAFAMVSLISAAYWPNWYFQVRPLCGATFVEYAAQAAVPLLISLASGALALAGASVMENDLLRLSLGLALGTGTYLWLSQSFNKDWFKSIIELIVAPLSKKLKA